MSELSDDMKPWVLAGIAVVLCGLLVFALIDWIIDRHPNSPHNRKRAQEIQDDPRWRGMFRVVEIKHAGGYSSYSIEAWRGRYEGWGKPRHGRDYLKGEWCWQNDGFETIERPASLLDKYLNQQRDAIVEARQVALPEYRATVRDAVAALSPTPESSHD